MIDQQIIDTIFLVVPQLSADVILGSKWLAHNEGIIDYKKLEVRLQNAVIRPLWVSFEWVALSEQNSQNNQEKTKINTMSSLTCKGINNTNEDNFGLDIEEKENMMDDRKDENNFNISKLFKEE